MSEEKKVTAEELDTVVGGIGSGGIDSSLTCMEADDEFERKHPHMGVVSRPRDTPSTTVHSERKTLFS